jgi:hypothetical protein
VVLIDDHAKSQQIPLGNNEEKYGKGIVDVAIKNSISHFVYTSADRGKNSETDPTNVPHFITKYNIEKHLAAQAKGTNMTWTVLRPVAFLENLTPDFFGKVFTSSWLMRLGEQDKKLQVIATSDVGFFGAQSFINADSEQFRNQSIGLAGDELTFSEMKTIFEKKTRETLPTTYIFVASLINGIAKDLGYMFKWMRAVGCGVDIASLKKTNPAMKDFGTWLETESAWKKT